jgi:hypothetical protein
MKNTSKSYITGLSWDIGPNNYLIYDETAAATRLAITSGGNVGIGTTTPTNLASSYRSVCVNGSSAGFFETRVSDVSSGRFISDSNATGIGDVRSGKYLYLYTEDTERMRIKASNGYVGIGNTDPSYRLVVNKVTQSAPALMIGGALYGGPRIQTYDLASDPNGWMGLGTDMSGAPYEHSLYFPDTGSLGRLSVGTYNGTTYSEKMAVLRNGNALIGTTSDSGIRLQVRGSGTVASFNDTTSGDETISFLANGTFRGGLGADANYALKINGTGGTAVAVINTSTGAYTATSDSILKKNISDSPLALPVLNQIKIRQYNWNSDDSFEQYGVIAQELYEITPTYVFKPKKETDKWGVSKAELVPLLIKAIQEQQKQIEELKSLIN